MTTKPMADQYRDIETRRDVDRQADFTVGNCARCGDDHEGLSVVTFFRPIEDHEDGFEWIWWAECPTTGDPILICEKPKEAD
ncbi:hypothetical protein LCGC14_0443820 [marine sediment metagenome]|uniref:Uncharacterized protein n=1 Tax=marine sediment metagenome TaxID=412755 RepID=A0A0F9V6P2_9ZZZZ